MQAVSDIIEYQEVHLWDTFWNIIGPYSVKTRLASRSCQDCSYCQFTTTKISSASVERNIGTYRLLHKIYKRVCTDHYANGKIVKEGY
jgi:hypothetical protein